MYGNMGIWVYENIGCMGIREYMSIWDYGNMGI